MNHISTIAPDVPVQLQWTTKVEYGFSLSCLRQPGHGFLEADLGVEIPGAVADIQWRLGGGFRLDSKSEPDGTVRLRVLKTSCPNTAASVVSPKDRTVMEAFPRFDDLLSAISSGLALDGAEAAESVELCAGIRDRILEKVLPALETKLSLQSSYWCQHADADVPLIDCTFAATECGREAYRAAVGGNLTPLFAAGGAHAKLHAGVLSDRTAKVVRLEIHMPYLGRGEWRSRLETLARVSVAQTPDGQLLAFAGTLAQSPANIMAYQTALILAAGLNGAADLNGAAASKFTLAFTDTHQMMAGRLSNLLEPFLIAHSFSTESLDCLRDLASAHPREITTAAITLKLPGSVVGVWLKTPAENDTEYFRTYSSMSKAVQAALRRWLPYVYFTDLDRCRNHGASYSMLVYRFSRPFRGTPRSEFTYDVLNPGTFGMAFHPGRQKMIGGLQPIVQALIEHGDPKTAKYYINKRRPRILAAVIKQWNSIHDLFTCDKLCVNQLVKLGLRANQLNQELANNGDRPGKDLPDVADDCAKTFEIALRRLCECQEFVTLGPMVLIEATAALNNTMKLACEVEAMLEITSASTRQIFFNRAYRPD